MGTAFGGVSVKELTQALKDGLLDPNALRTPASILNPFATKMDAALGSMHSAFFEAVNIVNGDYSTGPLGFTPRFLTVLLWFRYDYYGGFGSVSYGFATGLAAQGCLSAGLYIYPYDDYFGFQLDNDHVGNTYSNPWDGPTGILTLTQFEAANVKINASQINTNFANHLYYAILGE